MEEKLIEWLKKQIEKIDTLEKEWRKSINFDAWKLSTERLLERISWNQSSYVNNFSRISYSLSFITWSTQDYEWENAYQKWLKNAREILKWIVEELEEYWLPEIIKNEWKTQKNNTEVTVNLNQTLNINIKNTLENNLTVSQYNQLQTILDIKDKKEKENKLSHFLVWLWINWVTEILKSILLN